MDIMYNTTDRKTELFRATVYVQEKIDLLI